MMQCPYAWCLILELVIRTFSDLLVMILFLLGRLAMRTGKPLFDSCSYTSSNILFRPYLPKPRRRAGIFMEMQGKGRPQPRCLPPPELRSLPSFRSRLPFLHHILMMGMEHSGQQYRNTWRSSLWVNYSLILLVAVRFVNCLSNSHLIELRCMKINCL